MRAHVRSTFFCVCATANRDEFHARPTSPLAWRSLGQHEPQAEPRILAGLDEAAGGTWLGLSKTGRLALLTNIAEAVPSPRLQNGQLRPSRGALVAAFLEDDSVDPESFAQRHEAQLPDYAGFNLLVAIISSDAESCRFAVLSNRHGNHTEESGTWGGSDTRQGSLSNGRFIPDVRKASAAAGAWPKVLRGEASFCNLVTSSGLQSDTSQPEESLIEDLLNLMT